MPPLNPQTVKQQRTELGGQNSVPNTQGQLLKENSPLSSSKGPDSCPGGSQSSESSGSCPQDNLPPKSEPNIPEVSVRTATSDNTKCLSMVVPIEVKGHKTSAVVDGGAQVSIINQGLFEGLNHMGPREPVCLKGIAPNKSFEGYLVRDVLLSLGGQSYHWDLCCSY